MAERVLILGASARAAAASARRAGLEPFAIDLFADRDTKQICEVLCCPFEEYPEGLFRLARTAPPMPWMYTGGLENYPDLVGELAKERELWGNGSEVLRKVRDPRWLHANLNGGGYRYPVVVMPGEAVPPDGSWVYKPVRGAGGMGVRIAIDDDIQAIEEFDSQGYLQQYAGPPRFSQSAVFIERGGIPMNPEDFVCSASQQLIGTSWTHGRDFQYCGTIGPVYADFPNLRRAMVPLLKSNRLRGVWGFDFIAFDSFVMIFEVNPRYTASIEALEYSSGMCALDWGKSHFNAHGLTIGKAIYYAPAQFSFPGSGPWDDSLARAADVWTRPDYADIPHPGDVIEAGHPVLTILTDADTEDACLAKLKARAAELDRLFGFATPTQVPSPLVGEG